MRLCGGILYVEGVKSTGEEVILGWYKAGYTLTNYDIVDILLASNVHNAVKLVANASFWNIRVVRCRLLVSSL